jgi:hypothetical protein
MLKVRHLNCAATSSTAVSCLQPKQLEQLQQSGEKSAVRSVGSSAAVGGHFVFDNCFHLLRF